MEHRDGEIVNGFSIKKSLDGNWGAHKGGKKLFSHTDWEEVAKWCRLPTEAKASRKFGYRREYI